MVPSNLRISCLIAIACSLFATGCGPGFGNAKPWTPPLTPQEQFASAFNSWLGVSKDERIKRIGVPTACMVLSTGEEACDWVNQRLFGKSFSYSDKFGGVGAGSLNSEEHRVTFTYDREHIARFWSYNGNLGSFTSQTPPSPK